MRSLALLATVVLLALAAVPARAADPLPDLVILGGSISPTAPQPGQIVVFSLTVRNQGGAASNPTDLLVTTSFMGDAAGPIPSLAAGESTLVQVTLTAQPGSGSVEATANWGAHSLESDYANNGFALGELTVVLPPPDVAVSIVSIEKARFRTDFGDVPNPEGARTVTTRFCNVGPGAAESVNVLVEVQSAFGGRTLRAQNAGSLAPGECRTLVDSWSPVGAIGDVTFHAEAFAENETTYQNNGANVQDFVILGGLGAGAILP